MLYADDAGVVSQSPEQSRKMMGVTVVVCAAFSTVSEATTEIMCLRAKRMPESTATFSVEAAGQGYNQTNEFEYLELKIRMLRADVLETMLYGCVTWSPLEGHYVTLRRAHHNFLTRCMYVCMYGHHI